MGYYANRCLAPLAARLDPGHLFAAWPRHRDPADAFVGTWSECLTRYAELATVDKNNGDDCSLLIADLSNFLGELIDPASPAALQLYAAAHGYTDTDTVDPESAYCWLVDEAQHKAEYVPLLANIACRQGAITAAQLAALLRAR